MKEARCARNAAPALFSPYRALTIMAVLPASGPNSGPRIVHTFSVSGAVIYALSTSPTLTSQLLRAAIVKAKRTVSHETTLAYVMVGGASVICPQVTSLAFRRKSSILTSKTIWQFILW